MLDATTEFTGVLLMVSNWYRTEISENFQALAYDHKERRAFSSPKYLARQHLELDASTMQLTCLVTVGGPD